MGIWAADQLLRLRLRGRHSPGRLHSPESRAAGGLHRDHSRSQQPCAELGQVLAAEVPFFPKTCAKPHRRGNQGGGTSKYLGVMLSRNCSSRKDVSERPAKARKHFNTLHHFWRHTFRIYNAVFVPLVVCGMESAALTQADLHRLESFNSKALRKMHRIPATFYRKVLDSSQPTTSNQ